MRELYMVPDVVEYGHLDDIVLQGSAEIGRQIVSFVEITSIATPTYSVSNILE